jgi:hypothetical protein
MAVPVTAAAEKPAVMMMILAAVTAGIEGVVRTIAVAFTLTVAKTIKQPRRGLPRTKATGNQA